MLRLVVYSCVSHLGSTGQLRFIYVRGLQKRKRKRKQKKNDLPVILKLNQELQFAANKQIKSLDSGHLAR